MDFAQAAELPIIETVRGTDIEFPLVKIRDYKPWIAELTKTRITQSLLLIPKDATPIDRFRMARIAQFDKPSMDAIASLVWTDDGSIRVLELSLTKKGFSKADATEIIDNLPTRRVVSLAVEVSGLFESNPPALEQANGQPDPNVEAAQENSAEPVEIGS